MIKIITYAAKKDAYGVDGGTRAADNLVHLKKSEELFNTNVEYIKTIGNIQI